MILMICALLGIARVFFQVEMWIYGLIHLVGGICSAWVLTKVQSLIRK